MAARVAGRLLRSRESLGHDCGTGWSLRRFALQSSAAWPPRLAVLAQRNSFEPLAMVSATGMKLLASVAALGRLATASATGECSSWSTRYEQFIDGVCVCNASSCDSVSSEYLALTGSELGVFQTSQAGDRLAYSTVALRSDGTSGDGASTAEFVIDSSTTYQEIIGFGGAFTDAAAINVYLMDAAVQQLLVDAYFSDEGLAYTLGRIPIASTDFSTHVYSYNDGSVGDFEMANFSIDADRTPQSNKLAFIQRALNASAGSGRNVTMFASSWAPPVWLTTGNTTVNCAINGTAGGEYWQALALYYSKFISAYEAEGIPIWAMTTQNEPYQQPIVIHGFQSLRMTDEEERDFIKLNLGPTLKENNPDVKIIMMDDQKDQLLTWNASIVDEDARQYVSGVGVHWYKNVDFISKLFGNFDDLATFHEKNPDLFILATEACEGSMIEGVGTGVGTALLQYNVTWKRGENYARDIINDLANFAGGWTDWNLYLNTSGGPNWALNDVDAPILVDEEGGAEFYKQPMYYVMGHFSKFLPPGSLQVSLNISASNSSAIENVDRVVFLTPNGSIVLIVSNRDTDSKQIAVRFEQQDKQASLSIPGNAVLTVLLASGSGSGSGSEVGAAGSGSESSGAVSGQRNGNIWTAILATFAVAVAGGAFMFVDED
jgi:glucosylceramidase